MTTIYVYIGRRTLTSGKLGHLYREVLPEGAPKDHIFQGKIVAAEIGSRYEFTIEGDSVIVGGTRKPKFLGMASDKEVIDWRLLDHAAYMEFELSKKEKKQQLRDPIRIALEPILRAMRQTNPTGRRAIKLLVQTYLDLYNP